MYKVYIRTNDGLVIAINSDAFLTDVTDWVFIDEGDGDCYHHAQGNYLPKGLRDDYGRCNYKCVDGELIERMDEEKEPLPAPEPTADEKLDALLEGYYGQ